MTPDDQLTRRLFLCGLGLVYFAAFVSLWVQVDGLIGSGGILPAADFLRGVEPSLGPSRWWRAPTLAWLSGGSDAALHLCCAAGTVAGLALAAGFAPALSAAAAWVLYLSLFVLGQDFLSFQWDILLLESGFLAVFYTPPLAWAPWSPGWRAPPSRLVTWLLRLLVAKLMLLSGLVKLAGGDPTWSDLTALSYHYETTCLPTWTGWYAHQLPMWFHRLSAGLMYAVELGLPFAALGPRPLRLAAAAGFVGLMAFIGATGNYGFFNPLAVVLCIPLLDDGVWPHQLLARTARPTGSARDGAEVSARTARPTSEGTAVWPLMVTLPLAVFIVALTPVPVLRSARLPVELPQPLPALFAAQAPFHLVNGYGLFANMTTERPEIVIEGSNDGLEWRPYELRWKPGDPNRRPQFVEPHMPRLDWQMWFAALGEARSNPWFLHFCHRLLQGSPAVVELLAGDPFPGAPPRYLRALVYDYRFTTAAERRETGAWWHRDLVRPYLPRLTLGADGKSLVAAP